MIRHKITITYRDDKTEEFDCYDYPSVGDTWIVLRMEADFTKHIPAQAIQNIGTKDYWKEIKQ